MSLQRPLVSVIVPAYNAARWIERTLASIQAQTWRETEIIVVDDGSSDDTPQRVERAAASDPRIRLVFQLNAGAAAARNHGIRESRGLFVAPIDSDDLWAPDNLERQVTALIQDSDAAFSFARSYWIDDEDRILAPPTDGPAPDCSFVSLLVDNFIGNGSACLFRRSALDAIGGYDEQFRSGGEDWLLTLRLAARFRFVCVNAYLIGYRQSPCTFSARRAADMCASHVRIIDEVARSGPKVSREILWRARTRGLVWYLPRLRRSGNWRATVYYALVAFWMNPLWFTDPKTRSFVSHAVSRRMSSRVTAEPQPGRTFWIETELPTRNAAREGAA